ncbi:hypothetical protein NDU88_008530, partial [Pleurodeles waltl]
MSMTPEQDHSSVAVSLDVEKAFDTLGWSFLMTTLQEMGFGAGFTRWISIIYTNRKARIKTSAIISEKFDIGRGTQQGCPLSPLLFALAIEPLAARLRNETVEWGIPDGEEFRIISLYADDALIYLRNHTESLPHILQLLNTFGHLSGLRVNWSKSCIFPMCPSPTP